MKKDQNIAQAGFTLVELMVTIIVLGIAIVGIAGLYYAMQVAEVQSQHLDLAVRAARTEIEDLRNDGYNSLTPGNTTNFTPSLPAALPHDKQGNVAISQPLPGLRRVDVTITYSDYQKPQKVILSSEIGVIGIGKGQ
ncbi:MAG: type IV pilus modification PilV family protein [Candidatus Saccharimonadales bacterium]